MKKSLIFIAMLAVSPIVFAPPYLQSVSCESDFGKCDYYYSYDYNGLVEECSCCDGTGWWDLVMPFLPTKEECLETVERLCKNASGLNCKNASGLNCENEAGNCTLSGNEYSCNCKLLNGAGIARGDVLEEEITEELCKSYLESNCGKEAPMVRNKCGKKFDFCVNYVSERSHCTDNHLTEEEVIVAVDSEDAWNDTKQAVYYGCCAAYSGAQMTLECLKEKCGENFTDECCSECIPDEADTASDPGDTDVPDTATDTGDTDMADTEETTGKDTADGDSAPATDSEAPAENKEESKSDGCSMLFV